MSQPPLYKRKAPRGAGLSRWNKSDLQTLNDFRENVADGRAKQDENDDHDNGDQDEDKSVFYEALTLFTRLIQHDDISLYEDFRSVS
jgi:hypothetical protein